MMIVRVVMTVRVDPEIWETEYGIDPSELRKDVRDYALAQVRDSAAAESGAIASVQ